METHNLALDICLAYAGKYAHAFEWAERPDQIWSDSLINGRIYITNTKRYKGRDPKVKLSMRTRNMNSNTEFAPTSIMIREHDLHNPNGAADVEQCIEYLICLFGCKTKVE